MKILEFLRKNKITVIILSIIVIIIALLLLIPDKENDEDNSVKKVQKVESSEFTKLFEGNEEVIVVEYLQSQNCSYEKAANIVSKINDTFDIDIKLLDKRTITQSVFESALNNNYLEWTNSADVIAISDGKIIAEKDLYQYFEDNELKDAITNVLEKSKFISEDKIQNLLTEISLDDYLNKVENDSNFSVFANADDINKAIYPLCAFKDRGEQFYYLNTAKLSQADLNKFFASNDKFSTIKSNKTLTIYVVGKDYIEFTSDLTASQIEFFIDEIKEIEKDISNSSIDQYKLLQLIDMFDSLPSTSILDFASYINHTLKAKMVLDKIDFINDIVLFDGDIYYVSKDLFDETAKELFGNNVNINIIALNELQSGGSCASWEYNKTNSRFERGDNGCGGDYGTYRKIVSSKFSQASDSYIIETKEAFIDMYEFKVYSDIEYTNLVGTFDEDSTDEERLVYIKSITDKLYTYKYTFVKASNGYYFKSYEVIK
jgi:hypothetical protein